MICPVCDAEMRPVEVPNFKIGVCVSCDTTGQVLANGVIRPIGDLLEAHMLGDDRLTAAISKPRVSSVPSFIDLYERMSATIYQELGELGGALRVQLAQVENRIDTALMIFSEMAVVSDKAGEGMRALREARDMVSTGTRRQRGLRDSND